MKQEKLRKTFGMLAVLFSLTSCGGKENSTSEGIDFDQTKAIKCYTRDTTSGTRDGFFTKIGLSQAKEDNAPLVSGFIQVNSNGDMIDAIKNDEYGIGYISLSSLESSGLKGLTYDQIQPSEDNVINGSYELTRNFNYIYRDDYASDDKRGLIVKAFQNYLTTSDAKAIIQENDGIVNLSSSDPTWASIKENYPICKEDNASITVKFGGSTSCDKICTALTSAFTSLCGNFVAQHDHHGSGDAYKYTQGAEKDGANRLDFGWLSREFNENEKAAEGTYGKAATDAIVAVVNPKNPYLNATADVLKDIYTGTKTTWDQVIA